MPPSQHKTWATSVRVARVVAAFALVLVLLAGLAPSNSLSFAASAPVCTMWCCVGLPPHAPGDCASASCHVNLAELLQSKGAQAEIQHHHDNNDDAPPAHFAHADHSGTHHAEVHHSETRHAEHHHSDTRHASPSSSAEPEHGSATTNDPKARWAASVAATSFHAPCPSDCGLAANGSGNIARPRDAAALADAQRPRPPTRVVLLRHDSDLPLVSARKHRLAPPRAPPCSLDS